MVTPKDQRALHLEKAKADAQVWDTIADLHAGTVEGQENLIAKAERAKATVLPNTPGPAEHVAAARDRRAPHRARRRRDRRLGEAADADLIEAGLHQG